MSRLMKWVLAPLVIAGALWAAQPNTAEAHPRRHCYSRPSYGMYYGPSYYSVRPSYGYRYSYFGPGFSYSFGYPGSGFYYGW